MKIKNYNTAKNKREEWDPTPSEGKYLSIASVPETSNDVKCK